MTEVDFAPPGSDELVEATEEDEKVHVKEEVEEEDEEVLVEDVDEKKAVEEDDIDEEASLSSKSVSFSNGVV